MKKQDIEVIKEKLKTSRKSKGELASVWGCLPSAATAFFNGKKDLKIGEFDKTAEFLGLSPVALFAEMRGETIESSTNHNDIFKLAMSRANEAVHNKQAKLGKNQFTEFVFLLYNLGISEKRTTGEAIISIATAELLLEKMLATGN